MSTSLSFMDEGEGLSFDENHSESITPPSLDLLEIELSSRPWMELLGVLWHALETDHHHSVRIYLMAVDMEVFFSWLGLIHDGSAAFSQPVNLTTKYVHQYSNPSRPCFSLHFTYHSLEERALFQHVLHETLRLFPI